MLPLRHLRIAVAVERAGGIRAAAESMLRAPSAVSRAVGLVETALGTALFERDGRGMVPTGPGRDVVRRYAAIEQELLAVLQEAASLGGGALPPTARNALFDERRLLVASLLAELQHMPAVAARLGVTQPAVSAALARLESALRQRLFLRGTLGMQPSERGARWLQRFGRALAELRYMEADVSAARGRLQGQIIVGALPLARTRVLPRAIAAVRRAHPDLRVHALESPYEMLCAGLLAGKVDFIVGALRPSVDEALAGEPLFVDRLGVMAAADHALARRRRVSLRDLRGQPWVLSRPDTPLRANLAAFFALHGEPAPLAAVETGDLALVRGMLLDGGMLTVLSTHQMRYELESGRICVLPIDLEGLQRHIGITVRRAAQLPAGVRLLIEEIRRQSRALPA